jgi:hypothetical protein
MKSLTKWANCGLLGQPYMGFVNFCNQLPAAEASAVSPHSPDEPDVASEVFVATSHRVRASSISSGVGSRSVILVIGPPVAVSPRPLTRLDSVERLIDAHELPD